MKSGTSGDRNSELGLPAFAGSSQLWQDAAVETHGSNSWGRLQISEMSLAVNVIGPLRRKAR
jgi:hypothetical protein